MTKSLFAYSAVALGSDIVRNLLVTKEQWFNGLTSMSPVICSDNGCEQHKQQRNIYFLKPVAYRKRNLVRSNFLNEKVWHALCSHSNALLSYSELQKPYTTCKVCALKAFWNLRVTLTLILTCSQTLQLVILKYSITQSLTSLIWETVLWKGYVYYVNHTRICEGMLLHMLSFYSKTFLSEF